MEFCMSSTVQSNMISLNLFKSGQQMPEDDNRLVIPLPHTFAWSIHIKVIIVILERLRTLAPLCFAQLPSYVYVYVSIVYHRIDVYRAVARRVRVRVCRENAVTPR